MVELLLEKASVAHPDADPVRDSFALVRLVHSWTPNSDVGQTRFGSPTCEPLSEPGPPRSGRQILAPWNRLAMPGQVSPPFLLACPRVPSLSQAPPSSGPVRASFALARSAQLDLVPPESEE